MFEISFGELMLIGGVALVVLGPEKLPTVARTLGALVGRLQRFIASVKADIHRETDAAGLGGLKSELQDAAQLFQQRLEAEVREVREASAQVEREILAASSAARQELADARQAASALGGEVNAAFAPDAPVHGSANLAALEAEAESRQASLFAAAPDAPRSHETPAPEVDENQLDLFADIDPPARTPRA